MQDWGGPIGFRFAVENPERVARLVVLNTGIGARAPNEEWLRFQAFMRRVGTEIVAGQLMRLTLVQPINDEVIAGYDAPFPVPESRVGIVQFPELVATSSEHRRLPRCSTCASGCAASTGRRSCSSRTATRSSPPRRRGDGGAAPERRARPAARGAGHFLQEDRGEPVGARIAAWLAAS